MPEQTPQESTFQVKMDRQKESLQKDIQARGKEITHLKELIMRQDARIADIDKHTSHFGVLLTIVLASTALLTYISVNSLVKTQAEDWFTENEEQLKESIAQLDKSVSTAKSDIAALVHQVEIEKVKASRVMRERVQQALDDNRPIEAEDEKLIAEQATQLKDKPESSYSYEDWNTRAFDAWINNKFELAADHWGEAASVPSASSVDRARALFNQGVALGRLGHGVEAIAVYDRLIEAYGRDKKLALRELVANAMNNKGYELLLKAKRHWSDVSLRKDLLTQANDSFEQAMQRLPNDAMMLGNSAYCAWLLSRTEFAEEQFKKALGADGGGERLYKGTLGDLDIDPVDADQGFRDLIDRLYQAYQGKR